MTYGCERLKAIEILDVVYILHSRAHVHGIAGDSVRRSAHRRDRTSTYVVIVIAVAISACWL